MFSTFISFLFEVAVSGTGSFAGLDSKKIDSHIKELNGQQWFNSFYTDEKYRSLFFGNVHVRKKLQNRMYVKRLLVSEKAQKSFEHYLQKQINKRKPK
ncbi:hypothetical protein QMA09_04360 [Planococcus sp. APC 3906]|uniref:hypothetical protein n=1 Tax=Planococcus sp. APC 3906 TaxID=3035194 RepID=UPI0025B2D334|nr:hypothetical protein [Planococcus sp. APC 3906]MDN3449411.1 hypothetical protein [Planococcus sp. APC 3906]